MACRQRHPLQALIRLRIADGRLVPDPASELGGRSAWVCPTRKCVDQLTARPRILRRSLRAPTPQVEGLREQLRDSHQQRCRQLIQRCARAGLVRSGVRQIQEATQSCALIVATDASPRTLAQINLPISTIQTDLGLDRQELGALVHRGPRIALAIQAGRPAPQLIEHLRRCISLS